MKGDAGSRGGIANSKLTRATSPQRGAERPVCIGGPHRPGRRWASPYGKSLLERGSQYKLQPITFRNWRGTR